MANCQKCEQQVICPWAIPEEIICSSFKSKPVTNADRIRAMNDEELAVFLDYEYGRCEWCKPERFNTKDCSDIDCTVCIIDWLKQEAKDGE